MLPFAKINPNVLGWYRKQCYLSPTKSFALASANASYVKVNFAIKPPYLLGWERKPCMFPFANEQLYLLNGCDQRKFIDWRRPSFFCFRWNWDEEIKLRGIRLQCSSLPSPPNLSPPHLFMTGNNAPSVPRRGWAGFCRYYSCCENALERDER